MKFKSWRHKAVDREEWASEIKDAKALRVSQTQVVSW